MQLRWSGGELIEEDQVLDVVFVHAVEDQEVDGVEEYLRVVRIKTKRREDWINFLNEFLRVFSSRFARHFARGFNLLHNLFFHVVELKRGRVSDTVVGQIQRYMGFVKDELAEPNQIVKGVIIGLEDDLRIRRALSVTNNIEYYRYEVSFKLNKQ